MKINFNKRIHIDDLKIGNLYGILNFAHPKRLSKFGLLLKTNKNNMKAEFLINKKIETFSIIYYDFYEPDLNV